MSDSGAAKKGAKVLPAVLAFLVVAGAVMLAGTLATWLLKKIVLPVLALILGWTAARIVYKLRD